MGRHCATLRSGKVRIPVGSSLLSGLKAYWAFEQISGNRLDSVGARHLAPHGTPQPVEGRVGICTQYVPENAVYLSTPSHADLKPVWSPFTLDCWTLLDATAPCGLIGRSDTFSREYALFFDGLYFAFAVSANGIVEVIATSSVAPDTGLWYYLHAYWTGTTIGLAVNNGTPVETAFAGPVFSGSSEFVVGRGSEDESYLPGRIDEAGLWFRLLTPTEQSTRYSVGLGNTYPF